MSFAFLNMSEVEKNDKVEESVLMMLKLDRERHSIEDELTLKANEKGIPVHLLTAFKWATPEDRCCPLGSAY